MSKNQNKFVRFSGIGVQMGVIIGLFTWLGTYLDGKQNNETQGWTVGLSLLGVCIAMYLVIKEIKQMGDE